MKHDHADQLMDELEQLARDYPEQPEWRELIVRVRKDTQVLAQPTDTLPVTTQLTEPTDGQLCCVCRTTPAANAADMCEDCAAMYRPISARAVPGKCSCGHSAEGATVYAYRKGSTEQALCGLGCVKAHFHKAFQVFLGTSWCSP